MDDIQALILAKVAEKQKGILYYYQIMNVLHGYLPEHPAYKNVYGVMSLDGLETAMVVMKG